MPAETSHIMANHSFGMIVISAALLTAILPSLSLLPSKIGSSAAAEETSASSANQLHSDFNGDGYDDLAIGVRNEAIGGIYGGAVNILYGSGPSGLQTSSPADQFWHQDSPGVEDTAENGDRFGDSLAAGDFNGDGNTDLAIGAPGEGAVHVLYGSGPGLQTSSPADQFWTQESPGIGGSTGSSDHFGISLAAGDFNGDEFVDLAIGDPYEDIASTGVAGSVVVLYGSAGGLQTSSPAAQFWHQNSAGVDDAAEVSDQFGATLAAADFDADGHDDLAIGTDNEDLGSVGDAGVVHVLYGSSAGLQTSSPMDQLWNQDRPGVEETADGGDHFGIALSAGDFNNDGYDDLVIATPEEDFGSLGDAGVVNVLYGSSSGLRTTQAGDGSGRTDQLWHQNSPGVLDVAENSEHFAESLAVGDFNGDNYDDLAIGTPGEDIGPTGNAGAVNVLYGSGLGLQSSSPADQFWHQSSPDVEGLKRINEWFATALRAGDFNNDGYDDLAIGVPADRIGTTANQGGAVNVLYGSTSAGLQTASPVDQLWNQNTGSVEDVAEFGDWFGGSLG